MKCTRLLNLYLRKAINKNRRWFGTQLVEFSVIKAELQGPVIGTELSIQQLRVSCCDDVLGIIEVELFLAVVAWTLSDIIVIHADLLIAYVKCTRRIQGNKGRVASELNRRHARIVAEV